MRKLLISVLIIILLVIAIYMCYSGITLLRFRVSGIKEIEQFNDELDGQILVASKLVSNDYPTELSNLSKSLKELKTEKENYNNLVNISTDEQVENATKFEKYDIEFLWTKIGNHAKKEGVTMKMDLSASNIGTKGMYNLNFTVKGQYLGIADFIHDIENDSRLGFKIENFKLLPGESESKEGEKDTNTLVGTFICKDISINIDAANVNYQTQQQPQPDDDVDVDTNTNTTNSTNSTNTTNTDATNNSNTNSTNTVE